MLTTSEVTDAVRSALVRDKYLYLLIMPGALFFIIFKYLPMWGILFAFKNYSPYLGFWKSEWVGLKYFNDLLSNPDLWMMFRNTLAISSLNLIFFFPLPIILSLLLNEVRRGWFKRIVQSLVYLPHFISWVIIVGICFLIFSQSSGIVNTLLEEAGFSKINFLSEPNYFWGILTAQSIWKDAGWGTIIFLAALTGINQELYESAKIDGAGRWKMAIHITIPGIRSIIVMLLILRMGSVLETGFEQIYLMMSQPVADVAEVFDTYAYRTGVQSGRFSYATAVGLFQSVVGLILVLSANRLAKKFGEEGVF